LKEAVVLGDGDTSFELERRGSWTADRGVRRLGPERAAASSTPESPFENPRPARIARESSKRRPRKCCRPTFFRTREKLNRAGYGSQPRSSIRPLSSSAERRGRQGAGRRERFAHPTAQSAKAPAPWVTQRISSPNNPRQGSGVDFLILETFFRLDEMLAALDAANSSGLPAIATLSFRPLITSA